VPSGDDEILYLRAIEVRAREIVERAREEGWLSHEADPGDTTPLQRAVNDLAGILLHYHFDGDGCLDKLPRCGLGGAAIIGLGPAAGDPLADYDGLCARLGVEPRPEGWALWHTWDAKHRAHTLVTTRIVTTEGLLMNWSHGISVYPTVADRADIAAVVRGWQGPIILSPDHARELGLGGK
jgi:hypothetical protein